MFRAAFLPPPLFLLITKPGNSHLSPIAQRSVNHSIPSSCFPRDFLSLETPTRRGGSNDNYLFESVNHRIIDRRLPPRRSTRSLLFLSLALSNILHLIAPCNNYPRGHRRWITRGLSHRGGWVARGSEREITWWKGDDKTVREVDYGTAVQGFHGEGIRGCLLVDGYDRVECCWKWKDRIVGGVNCVFLLDKWNRSSRGEFVCSVWNFLGNGISYASLWESIFGIV